MATSLPTLDPDAAARTAEIAARRIELTYDYTRFPGIAMLPAPPKWGHPDLTWAVQVGERLAEIAVNAARIDGRLSRMHPDHPDHHDFRTLLADLERGGAKAAFNALNDIVQGADDGVERADELADYEAMFVSIPLPSMAKVFQEDRTFAEMRLAGPNPMMLHRVQSLPPHFQVTEADVTRARSALDAQAIDTTDLDLASALADGRAFLVDYASLKGAPTGTWAGGAKFLEAPLALFITAGPDRVLLPVAIQVSQDPGPILTPADGVRWAMAKTLVNVADGNIHQAAVHLGHTHLVMEACAIAMYRTLATAHPVSQLLSPHLEGTFYINDAAESTLAAPGGGVDKVMAPPIAASRAVAIQSVQTWSFSGTMLDADLRARGVDDPNTLPDYPYRDDARLVRAALRDWVESYLRLWYPDDKAVLDDREIQAMFLELAAPDGGRIVGVPTIRGLRGLTDALTHIIFTGSAQHAAVNFPQLNVMAYAPAFPLAAYRAGPGPEETYASWLALLPPLALAQLQGALGQLLGSVFHTKLGRYEVPMFRHFAGDARTAGPLAALHARLDEVERIITARNQARPPYEYLLPSRIPQSINI